MTYECHITLSLADKDVGSEIAERLHWSTSEIERDPVLGKNSYFYLTSHDKDAVRLHTRMRSAIKGIESFGASVIRSKIELIIYDSKTGGWA